MYFNTTTQKLEDILVCDFHEKFEKFGLEWENTTLGFKYTIEKAGQRIKKTLFLHEATRRRIAIDETRFFNMKVDFNYGVDTNPQLKRIGFLSGYLWNPRNFGTQSIYDFNTLTNTQKKAFFYNFFRSSHATIDSSPHNGRFLMSSYDRDWVNIWIKNADTYVLRNKNIKKVFVPKFCHDRENRNFLKHLVFVKRHEAKVDYLTEQTTFVRVLYEYQKTNPLSQSNYILNADNNELPFQQKWHRNKGYTIDSISFVFKDTPNEINNILKPADGLINDFEKNNIEEINNSLTANSFFDEKTFKEKVKV